MGGKVLSKFVLHSFVYNALATRVVFGAGSLAQLPAEVERLGAKRVLMLSTPGRAEMVRAAAKGLPVAGIFDEAAMHTPLELAEKARRRAAELGADCCVAVGGGSTIGFGKAIALTSGLPVIAVPTTYSGSEMTTIWGVSVIATRSSPSLTTLTLQLSVASLENIDCTRLKIDRHGSVANSR